jgi:RHS repeat-associated protein
MSTITRAFAALALFACAAISSAQTGQIPNVCALPIFAESGNGVAGTTIGNYEVYARTKNGDKRFLLPDTSLDLQGLTIDSDLGIVPDVAHRSQLIGMFYTFERVNPSGTGADDPTYPVYYYIPRSEVANGAAVSNTLPVYKETFAGQFSSGSGQKNADQVGLLQLQSVDGNRRFNAIFTYNPSAPNDPTAAGTRTAYYCLNLATDIPANTEPAPGSSLQAIWGAPSTSTMPFKDASIVLTRSADLRAIAKFFDDRNPGQPVWAYSDLPGPVDAFPISQTGVAVTVGYNGEVWDCDSPMVCSAPAQKMAAGSFSSLRLGTTNGQDRTLNLGVTRPAIAATVHGIAMAWSHVNADLPLDVGNCVVRMDATPLGLTPGSGEGQSRCPESTPTDAAFGKCDTQAGQSGCPVTLRWRVSDAYPQSRVVARDVDVPASAPIEIAQQQIFNTGLTFTIPAGKHYRFDLLSGTGAAPAIGRTQVIAASATPAVAATGCAITTGSTCPISVTWAGGRGSPALYRYTVGNPTPALLSNLAASSQPLSDSVPAGTYRYELHSASPPTAQNLLAASTDITVAATTASVSAAPASCTITAPATTCAVNVSWNMSLASATLFRVRVTPLPLETQSLGNVGSSGSTPQNLSAGQYRFELRNGTTSTAPLLAVSGDVTATETSTGVPATPPVAVMPVAPPADPDSEAVGFVGGAFRVDESGNATYRIPLEVAQGRAGLAPQLALSYSSGSGDGIAGWGMALEGLSVIERCRFTVEAGDGVNQAIGLVASSYSFCLDGQRLLKVSGAGEGLQDTRYRTEIESYQDIVVDGTETVLRNGAGERITQPKSFTVYRKDGLIAHYGTGTGRRLAPLPSSLGAVSASYVEDWWLSSIEDRNGNEILFDYDGDAAVGSLRLSSIRYTGGQVDFTYVARTPAISIGAWGNRLQQDSLLQKISIRNPDQVPLHRYEIGYEAVPSNPALQRLASISVCYSTICQAPTVFDWYDRASGSQDSAGQGSLPGGGANFQDIRAYKYGDINGDGRADLVWVDKTKTLRISLSQPTAAGGLGFAASLNPTTIDCEQNAPGGPDPCSAEGYDRTWALLDFNGDGRDDLLVYQTNQSATPIRGWRIWQSNGSTFVNTGITLPEDPATINPQSTPRVMVADFNGDGLGDLLVNRADGFGADLRAYLMQKTGNIAAPYAFSTYYPVVQEEPDANGVIHTAPLCNLGSFVSTHGDHSDAIDFNSDGLADIALSVPSGSCGNGSSGSGSVGTGLEESPDWLARQAQEPGSAIVDLNSGGTAVFFASKGLNAQNQLVFTSMPSLLGLDAANPETLRFGDINGDGIADAVVRRGGNTAPGLNNWDEVWSYFYGTQRGWEGPQGGYCVRADAAGNCLPMGREGQVSLLDHDGDGRLDVWSRRYSGSSNGDLGYDVMLWNGSGFSAPVPTFFHGGDSTWMRGFADLDGDGYYDNLIMRSSEVGASWKAKRTTDHHKPRNLLKSIGYGLGATTTIDYAPLTFSTVYQRGRVGPVFNSGRGSAVQDTAAPRFVVNRVRSSAPTEANPANAVDMRYRYGNFLIQGGGRGGLGFQYVVTTDVGNALTTQTEYNQRFPLTGMPRRTMVWSEGALSDVCADPDSAACMTWTGWSPSAPTLVYNGTFDTWRWDAEGVAGNNPDLGTLVGANRKPVRVLRTLSTQVRREASGASGFLGATWTAFDSYDAYGNLLASTATDFSDENQSVVARTVTASNVYDNDASAWILGRLRQSTVTTARPGQSSNVRVTSFDYNATTGQLEVERLQPGGALDQALVKVHKYDGYGNEMATITCSRSLSEQDCKATTDSSLVFRSTDDQRVQRTNGRSMDSRGLYPSMDWEVFQPLSGTGQQVVSLVLSRDAYGNTTGVAELNGLQKIAAYDGFGRSYFEGDSSGSWSLIERRWCVGVSGSGARVPCPAGAVYRSKQSSASGAAAWTYRDMLDREVLSVSSGYAVFDYRAVRTTYDALGRTATVSEPYFTFSPAQAGVGQPNAAAIYLTTTSYDMFGRVRLVVHPNNGVGGAVSQTETIYEPRKTTTRLPLNANGVAQATVKEVNALGELVKVTDHLGSVLTYEYDATGNMTKTVRQTYDGKTVTSTASYDALGRKLTVSDPDRGTWNFRYNALGEVVRKWTAAASCEQLLYDGRGRVFSRDNYASSVCSGNKDSGTVWTYDTAANGIGALDVVTHEDEIQPYSRTHRYDAIGRDYESVTTMGGSDYVQTTTFDAVGRVFQKFFAGGGIPRSGELYQYNARGYVAAVRNAFPGLTGQLYYEVQAMDAAGRVRRERRAGSDNLITDKAYAPATGRIESISTGGGAVQSLNYAYDPLGNMVAREDHSGGGYLREEYSYDNLQRLIQTYARRADNTQLVTFAAAYDGLGNTVGQAMGSLGADCHNPEEVTPGPGAISGIGTNQFCYDGRGNQVRTLDPANPAGLEKRKIRYSAYDLAREIRSNNPYVAHTTQFVYGPERTMVLRRDYAAATSTGTPQYTYYAGDAEIIVKSGAPKEVRRSVSGMLLTQFVDAAGTQVGLNQDVLLTDALGSTQRITDTSGTPRSNSGIQAFSAFGVRAGATTGELLPPASRFNFDDSRSRDGFTAHQQIDGNGLIHMGARLYDPVLGRFVQADSMVPDATDLQQLNRYTYVSNNPLAFTDPTGHWGAQQQGYLRLAGAIAVSVVTAGAAGPIVGQATATQAGIYMAGGFASGALASGNLRGAVTGAFAAAVSLGIGDAFARPPGVELTATEQAQRVLAHAAAGGFVEAINGGNFGHGFVSAGLSVSLEPTIDTGSKLGDGFLHAMLGGTASELSGGKFANGALAAVFAYAFNQMNHMTAGEVERMMQGKFLVDGTQGTAEMLMDETDDNFQGASLFPARDSFVFLSGHGDATGSKDLVDTRGGGRARYTAAQAADYLVENHLIDAGQHIVVIGCKTARYGFTRALRGELIGRGYFNAVTGTTGDMSYSVITTTPHRGTPSQQVFLRSQEPGSTSKTPAGWATLGGRKSQ